VKFLIACIDAIDFINQWIGKIISFISFGLMIFIFYDVVRRYLFNAPTIWSFELSQILLLYMVCLGSGAVLLENSHINVDVVVKKLPARTTALIHVFMWPVLLLICIVLLWQGSLSLWDDIMFNSKSDTLWGPPMWISKIMIPLAGLLLGLQCIAQWMRDCFIAFKGVEVPSKHRSGAGGIR
jgi:TRAP-type C4-dicarboxylate transport system permease small subunit